MGKRKSIKNLTSFDVQKLLRQAGIKAQNVSIIYENPGRLTASFFVDNQQCSQVLSYNRQFHEWLIEEQTKEPTEGS